MLFVRSSCSIDIKIISNYFTYLDMSHSVIIKIARSGEFFPAYSAFMRFLSTVNPSVGVQTG